MTAGKCGVEKTKGRLIDKYLAGQSAYHNSDKNTDLIRNSDDRVRWRNMTAFMVLSCRGNKLNLRTGCLEEEII